MQADDSVELSVGPLGKILVTGVLYLIVFMFVLDYTVANVAIPYIAGGLASSVDEGTYVLTFFSIGNAVVISLSGWLFLRFGVIKTLIYSTIGFTIFSFLCGVAGNLELLVFYRFMQGAMAGPMVPGVQTMITRMYIKRNLNLMVSLFALVALVGPALGPVIGGYLCITYDWRWIFYINVPIGIGCIFILVAYVWSEKEKIIKSSFDFFGFFLIFLAMTSLQLVLDKGQDWDWFRSERIRILSFIAISCYGYFGLWCSLYEKPLMNLRILLNRRFLLSVFLIIMNYGIYMSSIVLIPLWLEKVMGYDAYWAGIAVSPLGIGAIIASLVVGYLGDRFQIATYLAIALIFMGFSTLYCTYFYVEVDLYHIMLSRLFFGFGVGMWVSPIFKMPSLALSGDQLAPGLAIFHTYRVVSGAIGVSFATTLLQRRSIHQYANMVEQFSFIKEKSRIYFSEILSLGLSDESGINMLAKLMGQQAVTFAFVEVNMLVALLCFVTFLISLFAYQRKKSIYKNV